MLTITIRYQGKGLDIRVLPNQRISDVLKVLAENAVFDYSADHPFMVYSQRKKEYVYARSTFAQAEVDNGDLLEIETGELCDTKEAGSAFRDAETPGQDGDVKREVVRTYRYHKTLFVAPCRSDLRIEGSCAKILIEEDRISVEDSAGENIYLNQKKIGDGCFEIREGSVLFIHTLKLVIKKEQLRICGDADCYRTTLPEIPVESAAGRSCYYKRSPRIIKRVEKSKIMIETPKASGKNRRGELLQTVLPPLGMMAVTILIGVLMKRGVFILMSLGATGMTVVFSFVKFFQDRKDRRDIDRKKKELYGSYLLNKRKEIYRKWTQEAEAYSYNYPSVEKLCSMVENSSSRIYERTNLDDDFLTFSVGHYRSIPEFTIEDRISELDLETDEFLEDGKRIKAEYSRIDKPQIIDLKKAHLGLVGEKTVIHEQIKLIVSQLVFAQSYHDVQFVVIYNRKDAGEYSWMRWFRHMTLQGMNVRGLICTESARDQILGSLQQILKERSQKAEEGKKDARFLPHYVFIIDDPKMIMDHSIMEFLGAGFDPRMSFSVIYTSDQAANLPDNIGTVLKLENSGDGQMLLVEKEFSARRIDLNRIGDADLEKYARDLGVLLHEQGVTSHIPESITFFDMYQVNRPQELNISQRWSVNDSSKSLDVPLGVRGDDEILGLNLHEKAHGPHGLIAGTTGSGKSELVQSYILSLAVNFHPYEVGFLLIDYKGGGMANLFRKLPHLMGTITNLDGSESMRALASIQAELRRREKIFARFDVNHINGYTEKFKKGVAKEPIPHLFIISDEFAELKKEQPEFMKELVSTARVGRSLGVHLILATQKPTGVVDDQIWSNSRFKLCLKVQNTSDSNEILHTADAANITQAGRAYLQVGNNEIYELFQSAWSGAPFVKEGNREITQDNRVYAVNALGQSVLINKDLSGTEAEKKASQTQLDAIVDHIADIYEGQKNLEIKRPWLPSLESKVVNPNMQIHTGKAADLTIKLGLVDIPEMQAQVEYRIDLATQGNVAYIASSGYGKSVFLENIILQLAAQNTVSQTNFYVLDFGNNALISLSRLPHMADYIMLDDAEKYAKFKDLLLEEVRVRKKKMASVMAQNFAVYNEISPDKLRAIVVMVDNYDAVHEMGYEEEDFYTKITRDGASLGIYTIVTAGRMNAIKYATLNNFKNKIGGFNFEESEVKALVGRSSYTLPEIKGRAMVKNGESVNVMQLYTPVDFADDLDYNRKLQEAAAYITAAFPGEEAPHIPILPEDLDYAELMSRKKTEELLLGLDRETVTPMGITKEHSPFLILGDSGTGKTNALTCILRQIPPNAETYIIDSKSRKLYDQREGRNYISTAEELKKFASALESEANRRNEELTRQLAKGGNPTECLEKMAPVYVVIDEMDDLVETAGNDMAVLGAKMEKAIHCGIAFIVTANPNKMKGYDEFSKALKNVRNGLLLSGQGYLTIFPLKYNEIPTVPDGVFMRDKNVRKVRIPKC